MEQPSGHEGGARAAEAQLLGWVALASIDLVVVNVKLGAPALGWAVRAHHCFVVFGQAVAIGLLSAIARGLFQRFGPQGRLASLGALYAAAAIVGLVTLPDDFVGIAGPGGVLPRIVAAVASAVIPVTWVASRWLAAKRRIVPPIFGIALGIINAFIFERAYLGLHLFASWMAALALAASLAGAPLAWARRALRPAPLLVLSLVGAAAVALRVPARVLLDIYRVPSASAAPFLAKLHDDSEGGKVEGAWYADRRSLPDTPPSAAPLSDVDLSVVLLTIDAFRYDLLADDKYKESLPHLWRLRDQGVAFTQARVSAPATVPSLVTVFAGRFYSQLYWTEQTGGGRQKLYTHNDEFPRLPKLLGAAGVDTSLVMSGTGFAPRFGITADFAEYIDKGSPVGLPAAKITDHLIARMSKQESGKLLLYTHYFEPHAPYDRGGKEGSPFERYLREVAVVDTQIGRILADIEQRGAAARTLLIVTGDHGEAFGEHNTHEHAVSLYDELTRVPLVFWGAGLTPRRVDALVTLADLGPTILDIHRVPTPATFMGQSLLPLLRGDPVTLERPVVSESGRLAQAMYFPDGYKLLVDRRLGTKELYYLPDDPGELKDLSAAEPEVFAQKLALLRGYFEAHAFTKEGYTLPYRP
jgi:arylsulfatase A-like enzyme